MSAIDIRTRQRATTVNSMSSDLSEELIAEVDEPPDEIKGAFCWSPPNLSRGYMRPPPKIQRRESLLTRQLHSETEQSDHNEPRSPVRSQSTWSSISMPSTAELTSDDGHSMPSTAGSPPVPATHIHNPPPAAAKPSTEAVKVVGQDVAPAADQPAAPADSVEAGLGRKRCIKFACKAKQEEKPAQPIPEPAKVEPTEPPKRKCLIKFACPTRADTGAKPTEKSVMKRPSSPPPPPKPERKSSLTSKHRGSDATVVSVSPEQDRKGFTINDTAATTSQAAATTRVRRYSIDSNEDSGAEATRFHEFAISEEEPEDWTQMSTCFKSRLTIEDTLKKESVIRRTCEEVEDEVLEEEEEEEEIEEDLDEERTVAANVADSDDAEDGADEEYDTDEGFHSDDEGGFASSDEESDGDSDFEWWKPGGLSTAATSVDQLDRLALVNSQQVLSGTSAGSASSGRMSPRTSRVNLRKVPSKQARSAAMNINRPASPELPDSTDFVCGTLDEDRPLEQAFVNRRKQKQAAKKGFCPQDIDPSFPTSDPEMSHDEDDQRDRKPSGEADTMHGDLDELDGDGTVRRRSATKAKPTARSPPPSATRQKSPPPTKQRPTAHSPPPTTRRSMARSPCPVRKLFGHSPHRMKSPAPVKRMTSPPNSPAEGTKPHSVATIGLGSRPQLTQTSSLPRAGAITISKLATIPSDEEDSDDEKSRIDVPKRGAVDIVKGLEKKREYRKRKLAQKANAKAATKGDKNHKVKPGIGCEKMREVGLALQEYHGKAEHILSL